MNIALIGRSELLYSTAELLLANKHTIKLIVTSCESDEYKKTADDFEKLAKKIDAEYLYTSQINDVDNINIIKSCGQIDIGISINYINVISQKVIDLFSLGILNAHGGDLPRYRGNACQSWAIINSEDRIGLCIHKMIGNELDSGAIIEREYLPLNISTKIGDVYTWMEKEIPSMFVSAINRLGNDSDYVLSHQSQSTEDILRCYPRKPEDGKIDWAKTNIEILRLINASGYPFSGAFCFFQNSKLIVWDAELYNDNECYCAVTGQVAAINRDEGYIIVITGSGKLKINKITYNNRSTNPSEICNSLRDRLV
jgi:methionyl-tRNA formyltransferase